MFIPNFRLRLSKFLLLALTSHDCNWLKELKKVSILLYWHTHIVRWSYRRNLDGLSFTGDQKATRTATDQKVSVWN